MVDRLIAVLDVGKTLAKLSLWTPSGEMVDRVVRSNDRVDGGGYAALDSPGIEAWLEITLKAFARQGRVGAIVPVGHGAAAAVLRDGRLACPPMDYEEPIPPETRRAYDLGRDSFAATGSPALPQALNLGVQFAYLEALDPAIFDDGAMILTWPQYWAWKLSGVAACEVTSLGCHTDLWRPAEGAPSQLALRRGWADRMAPLRRADEVLGPIRQDWASRTGLPPDVQIYCGLHDSNAALLAARGHAEIGRGDATVLSTGTWFVAMRSGASGRDLADLSESRDCLINVDAYGAPVPSARFMGGREIEGLTAPDARIDVKPDQLQLLAALPAVLAAEAYIVPTFAPGFGPFPDGRGRWINMPSVEAERRTAVALYAALIADVSLDLIGARGPILIEGRFAQAEIFVRGLAALRPRDQIFVSNAQTDVSFGALRLIDPSLVIPGGLSPAPPLEEDLQPYRDAWRRDLDWARAT